MRMAGAAGAAVSDRERVSHVLRRLSMGGQPDLTADLADADAGVAAALDLSAPAATPVKLAPPADRDELREVGRILGPATWWLGQMATDTRMIEERLTWFWHDHFACGIQKVRSANLAWRQIRTIRKHATGSFVDLLHAIAKDGAMLVYLDGLQSPVKRRNENFAREVMELHTLGRGSYEQQDVVEVSRACTGWAVNLPFETWTQPDVALFEPFFVPSRHDAGEKTILGSTGAFDLDDALDLLLDRPETARFVGTKLYRELIGMEPDDAAAARVASAFRREYHIMDLVEAVVAEPAFLSDAAVRAKVRTPLEKLVGLMQAIGVTEMPPDAQLPGILQNLGYVPFLPPNPAGYPRGDALLGPHQLVHTLDLAVVMSEPPPDRAPRDVLARFGLFDVDESTVAVLERVSRADVRAALALGSPEYALV